MTLDYHESPLKRRVKALLTKPHQPFFLLGVLVAVYSMIALLSALNAVAQVDILFFHSYNMSVLMTTPLFLGFLFTVLYRFLLVMPFLQKEYMRVFWTLLAGIVITEVGFFIGHLALFTGIATVFAAKLLALSIFIKAYETSTVEDKKEIFLILLAFSSGAIGDLLYAASLFDASLLSLALNVSFYVYAVGVVFGVAQKMVPNFFILYFNISAPMQRDVTPFVGVFGSLVFLSLAKTAGSAPILFIANLLGVLATVYLFWKNKFVFRSSPAVLWVLQMGAFWFFAAFVCGFADGVSSFLGNSPLPAALQAHMFGVGFITMMIIGFGSRVAMGHSGRKIEADKLSSIIFIGFFALTLLRAIGVFSPLFLQLSAVAWLVLFIVWAFKYAPMLTSD